LTIPITFRHNHVASVAALRAPDRNRRNADRLHSGTLIDFTGIPTLIPGCENVSVYAGRLEHRVSSSWKRKKRPSGRRFAELIEKRHTADVIEPAEYARWRDSSLGGLTESIELATIFELAGDIRGKRLLDLGCGDGAYSIEAFQRGAHVTGVDISEAMLESARHRAAAAGTSVDWCRASAESLPYGLGTFDVALAVTVFCFLREPLQVVHEVYRVLRPRGTFVIGELGRYSSWALLRKVRGWLGSSTWKGAHFWTIHELKQLLQQAGFRVIASRPCVYYPPSNLAAHVLGEHDHAFSFLGQVGAAFLAVSGDRLSPTK
jgi:ubiquinone/menaquinone biosynthesis C-methylase UbiE